MARTGEQLLDGFVSFIDDDFSGTLTSAGVSDGTTIVDTALRRYGNGKLTGWWLLITSGAQDNVYRRVTDNASATGTLTVQPAFAAQVASAVTYRLLKYDPARIFAAMEQARFRVVDDLFIIRVDESITTDGLSRTFPLPTNMRRGPNVAYIETPLAAEAAWNFLANPRGDSTTSWTSVGAGTTVTTVTQDGSDLLVPKYGESCIKYAVPVTTAQTVRQVVADMTNGIAVAEARGRRMTFAMWVECRIASRLRLEIIDDNGQLAQSSLHLGRGWELLTVEGVVAHNNATTLTVGITVTSGAVIAYHRSHSWFYYGNAERVTDIYPMSSAMRPRRDDTTQVIVLPYRPHSRHQLRLIGTDVLTSFGASTSTSVATPMAASIEIDVAAAELLYAEAAELLFAWDGLKAESPERVQTRIGYARMRRNELRNTWPYEVPEGRIQGPYD